MQNEISQFNLSDEAGILVNWLRQFAVFWLSEQASFFKPFPEQDRNVFHQAEDTQNDSRESKDQPSWGTSTPFLKLDGIFSLLPNASCRMA